MADTTSYSAILGFNEDLYFEYLPQKDTVELFNATSCRLELGVYSFDDFRQKLLDMTQEYDHPALESLFTHMRNGDASFAIKLNENFFVRDHAVNGTLVQGKTIAAFENRRIVGRMHPMYDRNSVKNITYDALTGLLSKMDITAAAKKCIDVDNTAGTHIAIVDIDFFKNVNDTYGHSFGDEVLKKVADSIMEGIGEDGIAGRIGGDEFFILFNAGLTKETLRTILHNIKVSVNEAFPDKGPQAGQPISLSMGSACYPLDASCYDDLFTIADYCLYRAKEKGRNRFVMYTHEKHPSLEEINDIKDNKASIVAGREDIPLGDAITQMMFMMRYGKKPPCQAVIDEFASRLKIPLILLYLEDENRLILKSGQQADEADKAAEVSGHMLRKEYLMTTFLNRFDMVVCNNTNHIPPEFEEDMEALIAADVQAFVVCPFEDAEGRAADLILISLHNKLMWNAQHYMYFKLFTDALSVYRF